MRGILILLGVSVLLAAFGGPTQAGDGSAQTHLPLSKKAEAATLEVRLGERLFLDQRFSSPLGDLRKSCRDCHLRDEDPQGRRAFCDFLTRSWIPWRPEDPRREGTRNSPTLLDVGAMPRLHMDGEFTSLEALVKKTLATRNFGWLPGEEAQALDHVQTVLLNDRGEGEKAEGSYTEQFQRDYGVDLKATRRDEAVDWVARSIADYLRSLKTEKNSPYDEFIKRSGLDAGPADGESAKVFAKRLLDRVAGLEGERKLSLGQGFGEAALAGFKIFFRTNGAASVGNCVACHVPPAFTDYSFHNTGVSQAEYDAAHGEGAFAALKLPNAAEVRRPIKKFADKPRGSDPMIADLGHWNHVDLKNSPLRRAGESDDRFLERMVGAFKTPTLRNLALTHPYMHNGAFPTLGEAMTEEVRLNQLAREDGVRAVDDEYVTMRLGDADVAPLATFLISLNEESK